MSGWLVPGSGDPKRGSRRLAYRLGWLVVGLRALAIHMDVVHEENRNKTLNQIETRLREVRRNVDGADAEQWAAEIGTQLRFIKNAWRNQAMHPLATYDEARAVAIYDNARLLLTHLSERLER